MRAFKITMCYLINALLTALMIVPLILGYLLSPIFAGFKLGFDLATRHMLATQEVIKELQLVAEEKEKNNE